MRVRVRVRSRPADACELRGLDEVGGGDGEHLREARGMSEAVRLRLGPRLELGLGPRLELGLG